uniref:Uncharacterized protein n=1 Tax=Ciona intestinalis TaxID=7719 RepID=F6ULG0_CIOIN
MTSPRIDVSRLTSGCWNKVSDKQPPISSRIAGFEVMTSPEVSSGRLVTSHGWFRVILIASIGDSPCARICISRTLSNFPTPGGGAEKVTTFELLTSGSSVAVMELMNNESLDSSTGGSASGYVHSLHIRVIRRLPQ